MTNPIRTMRAENKRIANAVLSVVPDSRWSFVSICRGYVSLDGGADRRIVIDQVHDECRGSLKKREINEIFVSADSRSIVEAIPPRERRGSAANPITKLFPAAITEQRFVALLKSLTENRDATSWSDDRESGHTLSDFSLHEGHTRIPLNVKNAGTRFENAQQLVGLAPDDCIPIPAYKAHAAIEKLPLLLYVVSVDYGLIRSLNDVLPGLFSEEERTVWAILNEKSGYMLKDAEDRFVSQIVQRHWEQIRRIVTESEFRVVSARKAIRILQTQPNRTPGIGLKAWGTGASAEVNVHLSLADDTVPWSYVEQRIISDGLAYVETAVGRRRQELVFDPEF